jgi:hypothetical protein
MLQGLTVLAWLGSYYFLSALNFDKIRRPPDTADTLGIDINNGTSMTRFGKCKSGIRPRIGRLHSGLKIYLHLTACCQGKF